MAFVFSMTNIRFWKLFDVQGYEPFVSYQDLERLHRFIFVMAITHISYSCLTMLLAIVKVMHFELLLLVVVFRVIQYFLVELVMSFPRTRERKLCWPWKPSSSWTAVDQIQDTRFDSWNKRTIISLSPWPTA
jgi:hypothetical protein